MLTYVVQIWTPADDRWPAEMRGTVRDIGTGDVRPFRGVAALVEMLHGGYDVQRSAVRSMVDDQAMQ